MILVAGGCQVLPGVGKVNNESLGWKAGKLWVLHGKLGICIPWVRTTLVPPPEGII